MSSVFDPYYIWLGIPPDDQPPNHYRLLGIELFEASGEVIEAAANRQMAYMQEVSAGEQHIDEAQKILGELSRARVCLLSAEKKKSYDDELRASFDSLDRASEEQDADQGTQTPAVASLREKSFLPPQTLPQAQADESDTAPVLETHTPRVGSAKKHRTTPRKKKKKQDATVPILMGIGAAILAVIFLVVVLNSTGSKPPKQQTYNERQQAKFEKKRQENIAKRENQGPRQKKQDRRQLPRPQSSTTRSSPKNNASSNVADPLAEAAAALAAKRSTGTTSENEKPSTAAPTKDNTPIAETESTVPAEPIKSNDPAAPTEQAELNRPVAQANPSASTMPAKADLNPAQKALLETAAAEYKRVTLQEFQALRAKGREIGKSQGKIFGLPRGTTAQNSGTMQRFMFLGEHHPDIPTTAFTPQKKSLEPFNQEMRKAVWKAVRNTPAWKEASK